jgi:hypothetical protein
MSSKALTMPCMYSNLLPNHVLHTTSSAPTTPAICSSSNTYTAVVSRTVVIRKQRYRAARSCGKQKHNQQVVRYKVLLSSNAITVL